MVLRRVEAWGADDSVATRPAGQPVRPVELFCRSSSRLRSAAHRRRRSASRAATSCRAASCFYFFKTSPPRSTTSSSSSSSPPLATCRRRWITLADREVTVHAAAPRRGKESLFVLRERLRQHNAYEDSRHWLTAATSSSSSSCCSVAMRAGRRSFSDWAVTERVEPSRVDSCAPRRGARDVTGRARFHGAARSRDRLGRSNHSRPYRHSLRNFFPFVKVHWSIRERRYLRMTPGYDCIRDMRPFEGALEKFNSTMLNQWWYRCWQQPERWNYRYFFFTRSTKISKRSGTRRSHDRSSSDSISRRVG